MTERLVELGDLRGRRVLDVGCGTGRLATALAERWSCKVWGVDASPEMLAVARERVPRGVALRRASAERLPFKDAWFERVTMTLVFHHVDAKRALAEARRVLAPGGRLAMLTFDRAHVEEYFLSEYFPSLRAADLVRFPPREVLEQAVAAAGLADVRVERLRRERTIDREAVLRRIEGKHISTFQLIPEAEYEAGLERARRELPAQVQSVLEWLLLAAVRP